MKKYNEYKANYVIAVNEQLEIPVTQIRKEQYSLIRLSSELYAQGIYSIAQIDSATLYYSKPTNLKSFEWVSFEKAKEKIGDEKQRKLLNYFWEHFEKIVADKSTIESYHFVIALQNGDVESIKKISKSDLHNHIPFGGSRTIIKELTGYYVPSLYHRFKDILEMNEWCDKNIKGKFNVSNEYKTRVTAAYLQAQYDGIKVFAPNFALCARKNFESYGDLLRFIHLMNEIFSSTMQIFPELCLDRNKYDINNSEIINQLLQSGTFYSIDVTGDEKLGVDMFKENYHVAKSLGIIRKAHIGEFSNSQFVEEAIDTLELNCLQHGLSIVQDSKLMQRVKNNEISLTICPTSNLMLSRVSSYQQHPIKELFNFGIDVTICSDDILIFDSSVSNEYLQLYKSNTLNAFELNKIRIRGLNYYKK